MKKYIFALLGTLFFMSAAFAEFLNVEMYTTTAEGKGKFLGTINFVDSEYGLLITPDLKSLPPGAHGFHLHENPLCGNNGMAAGGHFDPAKTGKHLGPYNSQGHLGDFPVLIVDAAGKANIPVLAPKLKVSDLIGHAVIVHVGGDNYSDTPEKLGGGGARMACGVVEAK